MNIEFSDHAKKQIKERKIQKSHVASVVEKPTRKVKSFRNRMLLQKRFGSKILEVVTVGEKSQVTVITAYYLEEDEN
ncbi:MAG: hypothetical protein UU34_C0023G0007 [Candidatus Curtissbacteria bacterium GW2011_GWA1_41_11]|uniref:DUF4258 domain-containing protein n=1 Tax=Candidatus Curtissbacteria bacterium GW2011_GWA1_41_11 TaxID=1618409 RepID=A0A0G0XE39_9BACT|nr:MAG: hypothetical protein UU34_C0023G0007 [Candidatus Curtissbacteria bacterium GW2011_GWA1_41_11]